MSTNVLQVVNISSTRRSDIKLLVKTFERELSHLKTRRLNIYHFCNPIALLYIMVTI